MTDTASLIDDLGAAIGTRAFLRLSALYGGRTLYVPGAPTQGHPLEHAIGPDPFARLVRGFGSQTLRMPKASDYEHAAKVRAVAGLIRQGMTQDDICEALSISRRHFFRLRAKAEACALVEKVLR
jgi:hypothetical protein